MGEEIGSPDHDRLFFDHVITTIFKMLAPGRKKPAVIPEIPDELRAFLDECVDQIAKDRDSKWGIGTWEIFAELFTGKGNVVFLRFLLLHHNGESMVSSFSSPL